MQTKSPLLLPFFLPPCAWKLCWSPSSRPQGRTVGSDGTASYARGTCSSAHPDGTVWRKQEAWHSPRGHTVCPRDYLKEDARPQARLAGVWAHPMSRCSWGKCREVWDREPGPHRDGVESTHRPKHSPCASATSAQGGPHSCLQGRWAGSPPQGTDHQHWPLSPI